MATGRDRKGTRTEVRNWSDSPLMTMPLS